MADSVVGLGRGTTHSYLCYRDSGVEWLGEVPEHWDVKRLKFVTSINDESLSEDEDPLREMVYVNIGSVDSAHGIEQVEEMLFEDAPSRARRLVMNGDTIVSTVRTYLGAIAPVIEPPPHMVVSTGFAVVRPQRVDAGFISWALRERRIVEAIVARSTGVSYPAINAPEIGELFVTLPPLGEQRAIGAFLDRETERFDSLVAKMRLLIERLGEYRTALITRTVTRGLPAEAARLVGLDPSPPLKPSGMDWLGEVPEHWEVKRLKYLLRVPLQYGANEPSNLIDPESPRYIRITDIREDGMLWDETLRSIPQEVAEPYLLSEGDLLFARSGATVGKTFKYLHSWGKAAYAGYLVRARLNGHLAESNFVEYYTHSQEYKGWILGNLIQSTIQNVSAERYASLAVPLPPIDEQRAIATFLDRATERIDPLAAKMRLLMERLGEYRTALITAAVTGKIDVRTSAESPDAHLRSRLP